MKPMLSLAKAYESCFKIGAAVSPLDLTVHRDILLQHFNSLTCENQMKYELTEPEEGVFTFGDADLIVDFAKKMGIKLRAHAPVWHNQTGAWMYRDGDRPAPKELIYERIDAHTKAIAEHFNDTVYCWDVVNEATRDDRIGSKDGEDGDPNISSSAAQSSSKRLFGPWTNTRRMHSFSITITTSATPPSASALSPSFAICRKKAAALTVSACSSTTSPHRITMN